MRMPAKFVVAACCIFPVSGTSLGFQESGSETQEPAPDEKLEAVRIAMAAAEVALEARDLEDAREHVTCATDALLKIDDEAALPTAGRLDGLAGQLNMLPSQLAIEGWIVAARERFLPDDDPALLDSMQSLGVTCARLGDLEGAHAIFEQVHAMRERVLPADHPDLLSAKQNLAGTLRARGDLEGALALLEHLHALFEETLQADDQRLLSAKSNLAGVRAKLGDLKGAHELLEHVHALREQLLAADDPALLHAKLNLSVARQKVGDFEGARELDEYVHATYERLLPIDHPNLLAAKLNLAITRTNTGDFEGALALYEHLHATWERLVPESHPNLLAVEQNLAGVRMQLGDLGVAHALFEKVHSARAGQLAPHDSDLLMAKLNLAGTLSELGDLSGARVLGEQVHASFERRLPRDHPDLLMSKSNLAGTRFRLGDVEAAHVLYEHVHAVREQNLPDDHPDLLWAKENLAVTSKALGDLEGARALEEHLLTTRERLLSPGHPDLFTTQLHLAVTLKMLGDTRGAHELFEEAHTAFERLLPPGHPRLLGAKLCLAATRGLLGDREGALALEEHVHAARAARLPADHPDLLTAHENLAKTRLAMGDLAGTRVLARALLHGQIRRAAALRGDAPRVARSVALNELDRFAKALYLSAETASDTTESLDAELFAVLESLRQVSTCSSEVALATARYPELVELKDRLADARTKLNEHTKAPPEDESQLDAWRQALFELADDRDGLEKELRTKLEERDVFSGTISAAGVAEALDQDSAAVSFLRYTRDFDADPETGEQPPSVDSLLAFVVQPDGLVQRVELGPSAELEELCSRWRARLGKPVLRGAVYDEEEVTEEDVGRALRARILDPCLAVLGDEPPASLHLVLDDFLLLVPLDALPWTDERRLGEVVKLRFEVSMQRLVAPPADASEEGTLLALGGVSFGAEGIEAPPARITTGTPPVRGSGGSTPTSFEPLPGSEYEARNIGRLFDKHSEREAIVLMEDEATKKALMEHAPKARFLHLATHGWFAAESFTSMRDSAEEQGGDMLSISRADDTLRGFAPETLCGLALAGANHGRSTLGKVPGIITAEELSVLDLANCELAVLSACETNVGIRRAGQGIQSLQGALHAAGARTAITSLWKVDDNVTEDLMRRFYEKLWKDGLGKADALWQAKMKLKAKGVAVKDWSGWVLTGDPD